MNIRWFVCWLLAVLALSGETHGEGRGWRGLAEKIRPGMTRDAVEKILLQPGPDAEGSSTLYQTPRLEVESYSLDDERDLAVPYSAFTIPGSDVTPAQLGAQKVAARPWVIRDLIMTVQDADEPCLHVPLPRKLARKVRRAGEQAEVMTGDLFRTGHEVAVVAFSFGDGTDKEDAFHSLDAVAFYSKRTGAWKLRSLFPASQTLAAALPRASFLWLAELSGDDVPEVMLTMEQARNSSAAIFKYDRKSDRLVLATDPIMRPEKAGNGVTSSEHFTGYYMCSNYAWVGNKLVQRSIGHQGHGQGGPEHWFTVPEVPTGADDWHVAMDHTERNLRTGAVYSWDSFGNIPGLLVIDGTKVDALLWSIVDVGQRRRTILIHPDAKALAARDIKPEDFDAGSPIFERPERFSGDSKVKLPDGRMVAFKEWSHVEILDEWPLVLNTGDWGEGRKRIPANTVFLSTRSGSLDNFAPDDGQWRTARRWRARGEVPRFARDLPIALYISGPERASAAATDIQVSEVKLEDGKILHVVCDITGDPPGADKERIYPAVTINLGRLDPGQYTVRVELTLPGEPRTRTMPETKFQILESVMRAPGPKARHSSAQPNGLGKYHNKFRAPTGSDPVSRRNHGIVSTQESDGDIASIAALQAAVVFRRFSQPIGLG